MEFKEGFADKLEVPASKRDMQVFDDKLPGFGVRKYRSRSTPNHEPCRSRPASFFVKFNVGSQQRRKSLGRVSKGNLETARKEAANILVQAHAGTDVVAVAKAAGNQQPTTAICA